MAIFRAGGVVGSVSGKVGGFVYVNGRNGPVVRRAPVRVPSQSEAAIAARGMPGRVAAAWNALTDSQRQSWRTAAAQLKFPNRLGVLRQLSGFQLYSMYAMDIYLGNPPAALLPPGQSLIYAPAYVRSYFLAGGPYAVTSWGVPWPTSTPTDFFFLQNGRAQTQTTGFNRFRRIGTATHRIGSTDVYALAAAAGVPLLSGARFALADSWQVGTGYLGQRVWSTGTVDATPFVVDDFESGSLAAYSGDLSSFSIQSSVVHDGASALRCQFTNASAVTRSILSTTGLPLYLLPGHQFQFWTRLDGAGTERMQFLFGATSGVNGYRLVLRSNALGGLQKVVAGVGTNLFIGTVASYTQGTWYRFLVDWGYTGNFTVRIYDAGGTLRLSGTATDTTFTYGGIDWQGLNTAGGTCTAYYDSLQVVGRAA